MNTYYLLPKFIRLRDAPFYLAMDKNRFNQDVQPSLIEIPIGEQGIAFDRLDLDAWADDYKRCNGRSCQSQRKGDMTWDAQKRQVSTKGATSGTLTSWFKDSDFKQALTQATSTKRKSS